MVGLDRCPGTHFTYLILGQMRTEMADGTTLDAGPGDVLITPPGHDAWVLGDEPCVGIDLQGAIKNEEATASLGLQKKSFNTPDQTVTLPEATIGVLTFGELVLHLGTLAPGWRCFDHLEPLAGTEWVQETHFSCIISGRCHVVMSDGTEADLAPGDIAIVPPGHDTWVVGDEPCVTFDIQEASRNV